MGILVIVFLLVVVVSVRAMAPRPGSWEWEHNRTEALTMVGVMTLGIAVVATMVASLLLLVVGFVGWGPPVPSERVSIVALRDAVGVSGSAFMFSSEGNYFYYTKAADGGIRMQQARGSHATIYEDEIERPYVQYYRIDWAADFWHVGMGIEKTSEVDFHVPPNSVMTGVKLNLGQ